MKTLVSLFACLVLAACAAPAAQAPASTLSPAAPTAAKPDTSKAIAHLKEHVKYPADRATVLAACADTPEFTAAEKKWLADNLPEKSYASADEVVASLHL